MENKDPHEKNSMTKTDYPNTTSPLFAVADVSFQVNYTNPVRYAKNEDQVKIWILFSTHLFCFHLFLKSVVLVIFVILANAHGCHVFNCSAEIFIYTCSAEVFPA